MAGFTLLALLDDITSLLDDMALMTKMAAKKTTTLLSDDLAVNAEQVAGVTANRELPVVWAVAKGSLVNKLILIPLALIISAVAPWLINILLMIGGTYLSFEGAEKLYHKLGFAADHSQNHLLQDHPDNMDAAKQKALEKKKIRGAIRTDFVLSIEIIIITMSTIPADTSLMMRTGVLVIIGLFVTALVYGMVAGIVKLDDLGFWLLQNKKKSWLGQKAGKLLVGAAPQLMRLLTVVGTAAMFLVGGGILIHGLPFLNRLAATLSGFPIGGLWRFVFTLLIGVCVGTIVFFAVMLGKRAFKHFRN